MIKVEELFGPQNRAKMRIMIPTLSLEHKENLTCLFQKMNVIRFAYGKEMIVTSGLRTMDQHLVLYKGKNEKLISEGKDPIAPPKKSMHLIGAACDIYDENGDLKKFLLEHIQLLEEAGLWCEALDYTPNWVHFQIYPPPSLNRFFKPY